MPANAANPALGIGQSPGDTDAADGEAEVACAIHCCDKAPYSLPKKQPPQSNEKTCQRLGSRKHSCVLHKLREKKGTALTQKNKFKNVLASPRYDVDIDGVTKRLIPDTIVGNKVIDAKFPCDPAQVHGPGDTPPGTGPGFTTGVNQPYPSLSNVSGSSMMGSKELVDYKEIPGVKDSEAMTPADADSKKGNCQC